MYPRVHVTYKYRIIHLFSSWIAYANHKHLCNNSDYGEIVNLRRRSVLRVLRRNERQTFAVEATRKIHSKISLPRAAT